MPIVLTNNYVNKLCKTLTGSYFIGTFPCDMLANKRKTISSRIKSKEPFSLIVNLSPSHHKGTHFVAISYRDSQLVLFDSLALPYQDPNIQLFIDSVQKKSRYFIL